MEVGPVITILSRNPLNTGHKLAVGRTPEVAAATGPIRKGGVSRADHGTAGFATNPKIANGSQTNFRSGQRPAIAHLAILAQDCVHTPAVSGRSCVAAGTESTSVGGSSISGVLA